MTVSKGSVYLAWIVKKRYVHFYSLCMNNELHMCTFTKELAWPDVQLLNA